MKQETLQQAIILDAEIKSKREDSEQIGKHIETLSAGHANETPTETLQRLQDTYLDITIGTASPVVWVSYQNIIDMLEAEQGINETRKSELELELDNL